MFSSIIFLYEEKYMFYLNILFLRLCCKFSFVAPHEDVVGEAFGVEVSGLLPDGAAS